MSERSVDWAFRPDIEGLRAVAIGLVIAAHAYVPGFAGGFVGVDVFFVISGFLITGLLTRELGQTGRISFADFYLRRMRRLLPVFAVVLVATVAAAWVLLSPSEQQSQARSGLAASLWVSNIQFAVGKLDYFKGGPDTSLFLHTWSLGVEEQFYLVWPALMLWLTQVGRTHEGGRLRTALGIIAMVSFAACAYLTYVSQPWAFYMMPMRAWEFALGGLAWLQGRSAFKRAGALGWVGLALILSAGLAFDAHVAYPGWRALLPAVGAAMVLLAGGAGAVSGVGSLLCSRPCRYVGRISYGWYLWHWPLLLLAQTLPGGATPTGRILAVLASFLLASLTYAWVERPMREARRWPSRRELAMGVGIAVVAFSCLLCFRWEGRAAILAMRPDFVAITQVQKEAPSIYAYGCDDWYASDEVRFCAFGAKDAPRTVVLMGDSIAGQWFPAIEKVFESREWRILVLTKSSCPMVDEPYFYARIGREYVECARWRGKALDDLQSLHPDVVVLSSVSSSEFSDAQWKEGTRRVLDRLAPSASEVFLVRSTPILPFNGPDCLSRQRGRPQWMASAGACTSPLANERADRIAGLLRAVSGEYPNVSFQDWNDLVCPDGICTADQHGLIVFRDNQHISVRFAEAQASAIAARLALARNQGALSVGSVR